MVMTPNSATAPYCTALQALTCYAPDIWADMLKFTPQSPRPSFLAMLDVTNPAGQRLQFHLGIGAGEIEAACLIAEKYQPSDLQGLTGVSRLLLDKLNIARGMWSLYQFLKPGSARPEEVPFARESEELIAELRDGGAIFGFLETQAAGLPSVIIPAPGRLVTPNVVGRAVRLFPNYGLNGGLGIRG